jgi:trans-aconitate 2-methyltransferase
MTDWDPAKYLRFADERLRPALDLLARVPLSQPRHVIDLGCGVGNVTAILKSRFAHAEVLGIDGSPAMLARAQAAVPDCQFEQADIAAWQPPTAPDLIYSNAALHWLGGHELLFPRLLSFLAPGGVLAVQMPAMQDAPFRTMQKTIAAAGPWAPYLCDVVALRRILPLEQYWDLFRPHAAELDIWTTTYLHPLQGEDPVVEWAAGTSLRPFLDALPPALRVPFRQAYADAVRPHYPPRADGTTLLPFQRLFLVARI